MFSCRPSQSRHGGIESAPQLRMLGQPRCSSEVRPPMTDTASAANAEKYAASMVQVRPLKVWSRQVDRQQRSNLSSEVRSFATVGHNLAHRPNLGPAWSHLRRAETDYVRAAAWATTATLCPLRGERARCSEIGRASCRERVEV